MKRRVLLSWSSGKDSAWALYLLRRQAQTEVAGLLTTLSEASGRVAMHDVRRELLEAQAEATGLRFASPAPRRSGSTYLGKHPECELAWVMPTLDTPHRTKTGTGSSGLAGKRCWHPEKKSR